MFLLLCLLMLWATSIEPFRFCSILSDFYQMSASERTLIYLGWFYRLELRVGITVWGTRGPCTTEEYVTIKFDTAGNFEGSQSDSSVSTIHFGGRRHSCKEVWRACAKSLSR